MELPPGYGRIGQEPSALICRFKKGDESSLEDILTLYGPYTQRFLSRTRLQLSMEDIDDILSESLAEAWINREFYDPSRSKFKTWFNPHIAY